MIKYQAFIFEALQGLCRIVEKELESKELWESYPDHKGYISLDHMALHLKRRPYTEL